MKKLLAIMLTLVMIATFVLPAAADKYVPSCPNCGYSPMHRPVKSRSTSLAKVHMLNGNSNVSAAEVLSGLEKACSNTVIYESGLF